ncbi:hypothetical protein SAMN02745119_00563 [Trichlorobacter thiogenes]|uniref:Uncharacterized protein n=1 Tax=Trichlorobacter thiogenes TaxID=115783 RepID=A0A1T4KHZ6_9BACT|nr:hypothetical protein [Trichlorobacter thiogenes]SJZ41995.1 hypothetical protein SAMN02745119_00563 [Trichlorobacter thiogenes]
MYLARDKNNDLYLFRILPERRRECWWADAALDGSYLRLDKQLYPEITWDTEPLEVSLVPFQQSIDKTA